MELGQSSEIRTFERSARWRFDGRFAAVLILFSTLPRVGAHRSIVRAERLTIFTILIAGFSLVAGCRASEDLGRPPTDGSLRVNDSPQVGKRLRSTIIGTHFLVHPSLHVAIDDAIDTLRAKIRRHRRAGRFTAYISTPLSSRGGGYFDINAEVAETVKRQLERLYGRHLWALNPATITLPAVDGHQPSGGEYMYFWTEILAGEMGRGEDFDMIYFVGPSDFRRFFGDADSDRIEIVRRYMEERAKTDEAFRSEVTVNQERARRFLLYYGLRASTTFSRGAYDEWNIVVRINETRRSQHGLAEQLAVYFDGRALSPAEISVGTSHGYEQVVPVGEKSNRQRR